MSETNVLQREGETSAVINSLKPDVLDQLLKPEVQEALTTLVDNLPKLAELMNVLTKGYDLAQKVASDRVFVQDTVGGIKEVLRPIEEKAKFYASAAIEACDRAEHQETAIGLFGMLKLLKDPELQRMLRFSQAYLDILGDRKKNM